MADTDFTLDNGDRVKSKISGFQGMITARADHLNGCNRYSVEPLVDKEGKMQEPFWFDEDDLEVVKKKVLKRKSNTRGGFAGRYK